MADKAWLIHKVTVEELWRKHMGSAGHCLLRNGEVVNKIMGKMN